MAATTIKVSTELRDRLNAVAEEQGLTAGSMVEKLLEDWLWRQQVELAIRQMRSMTPEEKAEYLPRSRRWDVTLSDGLEDEPGRMDAHSPASVVWCDFDPAIGREQGWTTPAVVMSSVRPTSRLLPRSGHRRPVHHPRSWLGRTTSACPGRRACRAPTFAMTEQIAHGESSTASTAQRGHVSEDCLALIMRWAHVWQLPAA